MKIIKPPRATWRVCAVPLAAYCLLLLALPAVAIGNNAGFFDAIAGLLETREDA